MFGLKIFLSKLFLPHYPNQWNALASIRSARRYQKWTSFDPFYVQLFWFFSHHDPRLHNRLLLRPLPHIHPPRIARIRCNQNRHQKCPDPPGVHDQQRHVCASFSSQLWVGQSHRQWNRRHQIPLIHRRIFRTRSFEYFPSAFRPPRKNQMLIKCTYAFWDVHMKYMNGHLQKCVIKYLILLFL